MIPDFICNVALKPATMAIVEATRIALIFTIILFLTLLDYYGRNLNFKIKSPGGTDG
jgi:hypothetical protein